MLGSNLMRQVPKPDRSAGRPAPILFVALAVALLSGLLTVPGGAVAAPGKLGTNLAGIEYWNGVVPFNDIVLQGGEWIAGQPLATDRNGWPTRLRAPVSMAIAELEYPAGRYTVTWTGKGVFTVGGKRFSGSSGRGFVNLDGQSLVLLTIESTDPQDHLRRIKVRVPGAVDGEAFRRRYLRSLAPYRVLRFMDWQKTNGTFADPVPTLTCANATAPDTISQGRRRGASVEWMIRLTNRLDADPWFTVPHRADRSWVRCHARTVARDLERGLRPRYEFSNETWNPAFIQFHDLTDAAVRHGLGGSDPFLGLQLEVARRHESMARILTPVFRKRNRAVTRVLAGQAANSWVVEQRLDGGAAAATDEIAIAPYMHLTGLDAFDTADGDAILALGRDGLFTNLRGGLTTEVAPWIRDHSALARRFGKRLVAYEAGQHLVGDPGNEAMTSLLVEANRGPGMEGLYDDYLALWKRLTGNKLIMHFTDSGPYSRFGSWGALESPDRSFLSSPKYRALVRFASGSDQVDLIQRPSRRAESNR